MVRLWIALCIGTAAAAPAAAKPIAFADGTTVMAEYGAGTMRELQIFYAPSFDYSVGGGHVDFASDVDGRTEHITYARLNWLVHRWNLDAAQANVFASIIFLLAIVVVVGTQLSAAARRRRLAREG